MTIKWFSVRPNIYIFSGNLQDTQNALLIILKENDISALNLPRDDLYEFLKKMTPPVPFLDSFNSKKTMVYIGVVKKDHKLKIKINQKFSIHLITFRDIKRPRDTEHKKIPGIICTLDNCFK